MSTSDSTQIDLEAANAKAVANDNAKPAWLLKRDAASPRRDRAATMRLGRASVG
jgi:hypothetical protein